MSVKPTYYNALWHNCGKCKIHFMSEAAHLKAYLCDECWKSMPHYRTNTTMKQQQQPDKGPTYELRPEDVLGVFLYILGCSICLGVIAYYLWFK